MLTLQQREGHCGKKKNNLKVQIGDCEGVSKKSEGAWRWERDPLDFSLGFPASAGESGHEKGERRGGPLTASLSLTHTHAQKEQ